MQSYSHDFHLYCVYIMYTRTNIMYIYTKYLHTYTYYIPRTAYAYNNIIICIYYQDGHFVRDCPLPAPPVSFPQPVHRTVSTHTHMKCLNNNNIQIITNLPIIINTGPTGCPAYYDRTCFCIYYLYKPLSDEYYNIITTLFSHIITS